MRTRTSNQGHFLRKSFVKEFYRGNKMTFVLAVLSIFLMSILSLSASWLMQQLIDTISGVEGAMELKVLAVLTVGLVVLIVVFGMLEYASKPHFMKKAMEQYKNYAFRKLTEKSIHSFQDEATATYISALSNDAKSIEENYLEQQFAVISNVVVFLGAFIMMLITVRC